MWPIDLEIFRPPKASKPGAFISGPILTGRRTREEALRMFGLAKSQDPKPEPTPAPAAKPEQQPYNVTGVVKLLKAVKQMPPEPDPKEVKSGRREVFTRLLTKTASSADKALAELAHDIDARAAMNRRRERARKAEEASQLIVSASKRRHGARG
jgi:hypothetical protein